LSRSARVWFDDHALLLQFVFFSDRGGIMIMTRWQCKLSCLSALGLALLMTGCVDLRSDVTSGSADAQDIDQLQPWPDADANGLIVIGGRRYAEVMAGETLADVARRVNEDPYTLSDINNGTHVNRRLSQGTIVRLPAIHQNTAQADPVESPVTGAAVPRGNYIRHTVRPAETLYTIAEIYNISVRTLAEWNGLQTDLDVRAGMVLVVPVRQPENRTDGPPQTASVTETESRAATPAAPAQPPGEPVASPPAPAPEPVTNPPPPVVEAADTPPVVLEGSEAAASTFALPMEGTLREEFVTASGHDGLDLTAPSGTEIFAVADGGVALVSGLTDKSAIVLIRHPNDVYSVYQHIAGVTLKKGDTVTKGEKIAVLAENPGYLHFEIREGTVGVDPRKFLPEGSYPR